MSNVIGIDLGTSTSIASIFNNGKCKILDINGRDFMPSVVSFPKKDIKLVGMEAKNRIVIDPKNTVVSIKSRMGQNDYKVVLENGEYTPEEISAEILKKIVASVEYECKDVVICIPANFNDNAKKATLKAAKLAGLNVLYLLEEPIAAAIRYGFDKKETQKILVYDLGGGTFDICILELGKKTKILSKEGIVHLGGDNFDFELMTIINEKALEQSGIDILRELNSKEAIQKLKEASEKAKIELSSNEIANVIITNLVQREDEEIINIDIEVTRKEFNRSIESLLIKTDEVIKKALEGAKITKEAIDKIILVGGSTLVPRIKERVTEFFGKEPYSDFNPRTIVAEGAAIYGESLKEIKIDQIVTHNLGIMISGMRFSKIISKGTKIPSGEVVSEEKLYVTQYDNQSEFNIVVYQSEEEIEYVNEKTIDGYDKAVCIGEFKLSNIKKNLKGHEKVYVKFQIDEENIVSIKATSITSGSEVKGRIEINNL